jgi:hypothetical protein
MCVSILAVQHANVSACLCLSPIITVQKDFPPWVWGTLDLLLLLRVVCSQVFELHGFSVACFVQLYIFMLLFSFACTACLHAMSALHLSDSKCLAVSTEEKIALVHKSLMSQCCVTNSYHNGLSNTEWAVPVQPGLVTSHTACCNIMPNIAAVKLLLQTQHVALGPTTCNAGHLYCSDESAQHT